MLDFTAFREQEEIATFAEKHDIDYNVAKNVINVLVEKNINKSDFYINDVFEKPDIKSAPSNNAVIGRYILPKKIFKILKKQKPGRNGEIHITDSIRTLILKQNKFIGHIFKGKYLDCGSMDGYINSTQKISKL